MSQEWFGKHPGDLGGKFGTLERSEKHLVRYHSALRASSVLLEASWKRLQRS